MTEHEVGETVDANLPTSVSGLGYPLRIAYVSDRYTEPWAGRYIAIVFASLAVAASCYVALVAVQAAAVALSVSWLVGAAAVIMTSLWLYRPGTGARFIQSAATWAFDLPTSGTLGIVVSLLGFAMMVVVIRVIALIFEPHEPFTLEYWGTRPTAVLLQLALAYTSLRILAEIARAAATTFGLMLSVTRSLVRPGAELQDVSVSKRRRAGDRAS